MRINEKDLFNEQISEEIIEIIIDYFLKKFNKTPDDEPLVEEINFMIFHIAEVLGALVASLSWNESQLNELFDEIKRVAKININL